MSKKSIIGEICPPIKSREWKEYVQKIGNEDKARAYWLATKYTNPNGEPSIPTAQQLKELGYVEEHIPRAAALVSTLKQQITGAFKKLAKTEDKVEQERLKLQIEKWQSQVKTLSETPDNMGERQLVALSDITPFAQSQLSLVDNILNKKGKVTFEDLESARRIIALWRKAGDFSSEHLFMTEDEIEEAQRVDESGEIANPYLNEIYKQFKVWQGKAEGLANKWEKIAIDLYNEAGKEEFGDANFEIKKVLQDIGWGTAYFLDISETDNKLFELLSQWNKKANFKAITDAKTIFERTDQLLKNIQNKHKLADVFELFAQEFSNTDKRKTGNITFRYSQSYFDWKAKLYKKKKSDIDYAMTIADPNKQKEFIKNVNKTFIKTLRDNSIVLDVRKLLPDELLYEKQFSAKEIEAHKQEMITTLGKKGYEFYLERAKQHIEEYKARQSAMLEMFEQENSENSAQAMAEFEAWESANNPYKVAEYLVDGINEKVQGKFVTPDTSYIESVPRRIINGKDTGFYDKKFEQIEADDDILAFYNYLIETLNELHSYLPEDITRELQVNSLPTLRKAFIENLVESGIKNIGSEFLDYLVTSTRTDDLGVVIAPESRDLAGIKERKLQVQFLEDNKQKVQDHIDMKTVLYKQANNGKVPTVETIEEWKKDFINELASTKSFDLGKVVKAYGLMALGYRHKSSIEDAVKTSEQILANALEHITNDANDKMYDSYGKPVTQKGLANTLMMYEDFLNHFYGYRTRKVELQTNVKKYTKLERQQKKELEEGIEKLKARFKAKEIDSKQFLSDLEVLQEKLDKLGGKITGSKILDQIMQYVQLKGMGWNVLSAFVNVGFGLPANIIEASGGERFNEKEIRKAYGMTMHSMAKFWGGMVGYEGTKTAQKIFNLSEKLDILKESRNEIYKKTQGLSTFGKFSKGYKYIMPFTAQASSEYLNQAPVMIAVLMHNKFTNKLDGKEYSLWEAYDETGKVKEGIEIPDNYEFQVKSKIDEAVRYIHGNYDPDASIPGKQYVLFRMASQFRTWAFMGFYNRFGTEKDSNIAGITKKGRYRSYGTIYKELGAVQATFEITKQLLRKLTFQGTDFNKLITEEGYFTETDAANLRKNLTEIVTMMSVYMVGLLLRAGLDDDEDDKKGMFRPIAFTLINQMSRIQTDILFYTNPIAFEQLQRNALPIFTVVVDANKLVVRAGNLLTGGDDEYKSGIHKGQSKTYVALKNILPGTVVLNRLESISSQEYQKNQ